MANFTYKNVSTEGAATLEEAKLQVATAYLQQFGIPTQQEVDALLSQMETEEVERVDFGDLEADISGELVWIGGTLTEIDTGLAVVDGATLAQMRVITRGLLQNQRRILLIVRGILKAFRYVIRRLR